MSTNPQKKKGKKITNLNVLKKGCKSRIQCLFKKMIQVTYTNPNSLDSNCQGFELCLFLVKLIAYRCKHDIIYVLYGQWAVKYLLCEKFFGHHVFPFGILLYPI